MAKHSAFLAIAVAVLIGQGIPAYAASANISRPATKPHAIVLALSDEEQQQCQQEAARLEQQLDACTDDQCRQQVQAAIDAHNARCQ